MASHEKKLEDMKIQLVESEGKWKELKDVIADMRLQRSTNNEINYEINYDDLKRRLTFGVRNLKDFANHCLTGKSRVGGELRMFPKAPLDA